MAVRIGNARTRPLSFAFVGVVLASACASNEPSGTTHEATCAACAPAAYVCPSTQMESATITICNRTPAGCTGVFETVVSPTACSEGPSLEIRCADRSPCDGGCSTAVVDAGELTWPYFAHGGTITCWAQ